MTSQEIYENIMISKIAGWELGSGAQFKHLVKKLRAKGAKTPKALAAWLGRRRLGKKKMQQLAHKGKLDAKK